MVRVWFARQWRMPKLFTALLILEFLLTVATLTLMGIADPNTYRTKLWQNGFDQGFNSSPNSILYYYANWLPAKVPTVWSQYMTTFNVVISVLSMFILLVKSIMFVLHIFIPALSVFVHALLVALYAVSIYNQSRPDMSDPDHPSPGLPWYLSKGCSYAEPGNHGYCLQARASFAVVIVMTALFATYLGHSIWSAIPTEREKVAREAEYQSDLEMKKLSMYHDDEMSRDERREMHRQMFLNLPKTPNTPGFGVHNPMTPRTTAFTQLNGGAMPTPVGIGPSGSLPLRDFNGAKDVPDGR
ncbi:hypothetical protein M409DRAFT_17062 [Zasmidium cellare ATCC 36951]|uniref:MARVEL domain-containing protein n=1 Tax=Zasmidium cellare ATCC 36951 TaxID=1080233 RepID=A0A6A6D215_ZASCE|nr:uncharacterized protein M409DRAFT_17062 [Zasmidium cellare ATCC 36951]KAF2173113.1 hypothetical protein M409DRAFT_17062 [Zasmidium cellare ATCC 36951]